jgi:hypothetical protein
LPTSDAGAEAGSLSWAENFGLTGETYPQGVAIDPTSGAVVVTGYFLGTTNFGGGVLSSGDASGNSAIFLTRFDAAGNYVWGLSFGDGSIDAGVGVAIQAGGSIIATGLFDGSIDLGCGAMTAVGSDDIYVASFTSAGACSWSEHFGAADQGAAVDSIAVDGSGNIVLAGVAYGGLDFGGGTLNGYYLAKLNPTGGYIWSKAFDASSSDGDPLMTLDPSGNVVLAGTFNGDGDFGGGTLTSVSLTDVFVAKYSPAGQYMWASQYGQGGDCSLEAVATDGCGDVVVAGNFGGGTGGSIDFGTGILTAPAYPNDDHVYFAKLDANGAGVWAQQFVAPGNLAVATLSVDATGGPYLGGALSGSMTFGSSQYTGTQDNSAYLASFDQAGNFKWAIVGGAPSTATSSNLVAAAVASGAVVGVGQFGNLPCSCTTSPPSTTLVLDDTTLAATSAGDLFMFSLSP